MVTTRIIQTRYPDLIELGRVGHGGIIKIYFDADDPAQTEKRINNVIAARAYLVRKLAEEGTT
jgi:hypothetical protein